MTIFLWRLRGWRGISHLLRAMRSDDPRIWQTASRTVSGMGRTAIPTLLSSMKTEDAEFRRRLVKTLAAMGEEAVADIISALRDKDESVRQEAIKALVEFAKEPGKTIPILTSLLKQYDVDVTAQTLEVLAHIGSDTVDILLDLYFSGDLEVTEKTAEIFRVVGWSALPRLIKLLDEPDYLTSRRAGNVLVAIGKDAVEVLAQALSGTSKHTRIAASLSLARIGESALEAAPALRDALTDENDIVRFRAAYALRLIGLVEDRSPARSVIRELAEPIGGIETMEVFVMGSQLKRVRILPENPIVGELGSDSAGVKFLAPEKDYRGGGMGSIKVLGRTGIVDPYIGKIVRISGFYDRNLGLFAEKIEEVE